MKAMVFAAGIGSRLKPFTDFHPKALAPVAGVTALERVLLRLRDAGVDRVVVNVHHFAGQIVDFLDANGNFGLDIHVSDETSRLLDTGGGLLKARHLLCDGTDEPVLLHNADIVTDFPVEEMIAAHEASGAAATLLTAQRSSSRQLCFDASGCLRAWHNLSTGEVRPEGADCGGLRRLAFGGVHVVSPEIFPLLEKYASITGGDGVVKPFSLVPFYLEVMDKVAIRSFTPSHPFRWFDIGTMEKLRTASVAFAAPGSEGICRL